MNPRANANGDAGARLSVAEPVAAGAASGAVADADPFAPDPVAPDAADPGALAVSVEDDRLDAKELT